MKQRSSIICIRVWAMALCTMLWLWTGLTLRAQSERPVVTSVSKVAPGQWRIDWSIPEGLTCQLERSFDLSKWEPIGGTITSESPQAWVIDDGVGMALQCYWRIDAEGGATAPVAMFCITSLVPVDESGTPSPSGAGWAVSWRSEAGVSYRLERSHSLLADDWIPVTTVIATASETTHIDTGVGNQESTFWRVGRLGPTGEPLIISEVMVAASLNGATSTALFQIIAGGTKTVDTVRFFDNGVLLGDATPGFGDTWSFSLQWNDESPEVRAIDAEVTTEEGTTARSPLRRFLLADPSKFVPLDAEGKAAYGEFVEVDESGALGAFLFFPEGFSDPVTSSGAHFEFQAGSRLQDPAPTFENPVIEFSNATFYRGTADPNPVITSLAGTLDLANLTPTEVAQAFGLSDDGLQLCWGTNCVSWQGGALDEIGWANLQIDPGIGDFALPGGRLNAKVTIDPATNQPYLLICYFGNWEPMAGTTFAIPEADPLKIYLTLDGRFSAHGTAEASFENGGKVRGTISWREPVFEFSFEGKGIVIPALSSLSQLVPTDPGAIAPAGNSDGELDDFAETLAAYQSTMRGLAEGSTSQATLSDSSSATATASPQLTAGASLEGWAGRLQSWTSDRNSPLTDDQLAELSATVTNAARAAAASSDLATILTFYKNFIRIRRFHNPATSGTAGVSEFTDLISRSEESARVRIEGLIDQTPEFTVIESLADAADLLEEIAKLLDDVPADFSKSARGLTKSAQDDLRQSVAGITVKIQGQLFLRDFSDDNATALLAALKRLLVVVKFERTRQNSPSLAVLDLPNLLPAYAQIKHRFPAALNIEIGSLDLRTMRKTLASRAEFLRLANELGDLLDSNFGVIIGFDEQTFYIPSTEQLLTNWLTESRKLPPAVAANTCRRDIAMLADFIEYSTDRGETINARNASIEVEKCKEIDCDPVREELVKSFRQTPESFTPGDEGLMSVRATGTYETVVNSLGARTLSTMQLSQAGRLVVGRLQLHRIGGETETSRILGLLKSDAPGRAEFLTLIKSDNGNFFGGPGSLNNAVTMSVIANGNEVTAQPGGFGNFRKISNVAPFSPLVASRFTGESREVLDAWLKAPLHSTQVKNIRRSFAPILAHIINYLDQPDNDSRRLAVLGMSAPFANLANKVTDEQMPLARQILREMLNQSTSISEGEQLSHWNWLRILFGRHQNIAPATLALFMGPELNDQFDSNKKSFRYDISITEVEVGINTPIGELGLKPVAISIEKTRVGSSDPSVTINLAGGLAQGGAGLDMKEFVKKFKTVAELRGKYQLPDSINPADLLDEKDPLVTSFGAGGDDVTVFSEIDYTEASLTGSDITDGLMMAFGINASGAAFGFDYSAGPSVLVLYGDGSLPPFVIPLPLTSADNSVSTQNIVTVPSVAANFGLGKLFSASAYSGNQLSLSSEIVKKSFDADAGLTGSVHFEAGSPILRPCGWSNLRYLVAEMRAIFESPTSTISILGFTDATGSDSLNASLSQQRADAVKQAIQTLVGEGFAVPSEQFRAIGLGRQPSMGLTSPREGELTEAEAAFLANKKSDLPQLASGQANGDWRSVSILLNNLITIDLRIP